MFHIKTTYHPSGRYTCMQRHNKESIWKDLPGKLFGNPDRTEFYKAVSHYVDELKSVGCLASFADPASGLEE